MKLRELQAGELATVLTGEFKYEIFYRNVVGIHSLTKDRYWPSEYATKHSDGLGSYQGPLDEEIELINKDRLKYLTSDVPAVEVDDSYEFTVRDYSRMGSSVANLILDLELVNNFKNLNISSIAVKEFTRSSARQAYERIIRYAAHELSHGYDRRVYVPRALFSPYKSGKSLTVREFIHGVEDGVTWTK